MYLRLRNFDQILLFRLYTLLISEILVLFILSIYYSEFSCLLATPIAIFEVSISNNICTNSISNTTAMYMDANTTCFFQQNKNVLLYTSTTNIANGQRILRKKMFSVFPALRFWKQFSS